MIPETPPNRENSTGQKRVAQNVTALLGLLSEAMNEISSVRTTTESNQKHVANAKVSLRQAKIIAQNLLKEEENEKQQIMELMTKDLKDIKKLLEKPTFAQIAATEPPRNPLEILNNKGKLNTAKERTKKQ